VSATVVIAEIGECFNGDMNQAEKLIRVAAEAGCDYAKFQTLDRDGIADDDPERDWFLKIALDEDQLIALKQWCAESEIAFLCSPEKVKQARILKDIGCEEVKIASTCLWDLELVEYAARNFGTIFISTGLSDLDKIDEALQLFGERKKIYLMHCVSEYPTGPLLEKRGLSALSHSDVNMRMMDILRQRYPQCLVGYSDHTAGILAPIVAVARGAAVIEKHITLDRAGPVELFKSGKGYMGTDHVLSIEPAELMEMMKQIREAEKILGDGMWRRSKGEQLLMSFLRGRFSSS
jgi:sialic acid synthase SpsE